MKVALVYDRVNKWGGAERVLLTLHEMFPEAPLYTSVYDKKNASWASVFPEIIPSFLQKFPFAKKHHELYGWLMPLVFESFDFSKYDLVISLTSEAGKGIITVPKTFHLCYCLTPTRYLWSAYKDYFPELWQRILSWPFIKYLQFWDKIACQRPDKIAAISKNVKERIKKYYGREAEVIYPPIDVGATVTCRQFFSESNRSLKEKLFYRGSSLRIPQKIGQALFAINYFLIVSRLVPYKKIDLAIEAFNELGWNLKIIGSGIEENRLKQMAKKNVEFLGENLTDEELINYYKNCEVLIFPGEDDLGLVPIEVQACGRPVVAFGKGGALETVVEGKTGVFFLPQTKEALIKCLKGLKVEKFKSEDCIKNSRRFDKEKFKEKFKQYIRDRFYKATPC